MGDLPTGGIGRGNQECRQVRDIRSRIARRHNQGWGKCVRYFPTLGEKLNRTDAAIEDLSRAARNMVKSRNRFAVSVRTSVDPPRTLPDTFGNQPGQSVSFLSALDARLPPPITLLIFPKNR